MSRKRRIAYGVNSLVMALVLLMITAGVGYLATEYNKSFDFTEEKLYSLDPQTVKFLKSLDKKVRFTGFFQKNSPQADRFTDFMKLYEENSKNVSFRLVDPDEDPVTAKSYGITRYGTIVAESGENTKRTYELTEEAITNLLIMVTREGKKKIFVTQGHGERDVKSPEGGDISVIVEDLKKQGYEVTQGNVLGYYKKWDDDTVVLIPGVKKPFLKEELDVLENFISNGGKVIALIDPAEKRWFEDFLEKYGIKYQDGIIIDPASRIFGGTPVTALITSYTSHPSVQNFRLATFLALAGGLQVKRKEGVTTFVLFRTGRGAWLEKSKVLDRVRFDPGKDRLGPIDVAAVSIVKVKEKEKENESKEGKEKKPEGTESEVGGKKEGRLLVVADSDFISNHYVGFSGNGDLFMNLVKWMLSEEKIINIKPKRPKTSSYFLTATAKKMWFAGAVVGLPLLIFGMGFATWRVRRRK